MTCLPDFKKMKRKERNANILKKEGKKDWSTSIKGGKKKKKARRCSKIIKEGGRGGGLRG